MRTFKQQPKATQQTAPTKSAIPVRAYIGQDRKASSILQLQRKIGNQAVQRLLRPTAEIEDDSLTSASSRFAQDSSRIPAHASGYSGVQPKLMVSAPGDIHEQEADRVADQVTRMPEPQLQRACACGGGCPKCRTEKNGQEQLQTQQMQTTGTGETAAPPIVQEVISSPGLPLDPIARRFMESRFGHDFSRVRVHTQARAVESARAVNARAYTVGRNVVFGAGHYAPNTAVGQRLLAHELVHVVQQSNGQRKAMLQRAPAPKASGTGDLKLPWKHGDNSLFETTSSGIRFLVGTTSDRGKAIRSRIPAIAKRIAADNSAIKDAAHQVKTCFIVPTTTRFALYKGRPVLMLNPDNADVATAAHEMGHAIFFYLKARGASTAPGGARANHFRLRVADIYARLGKSKLYTEDGETHPAGYWMVDPSQWIPGSAKEHPWDDPDEFFASTKEAWQINRAGLRRSIRRFEKFDPNVGPPARELLKLVAAFLGKGKLPKAGLPGSRIKEAEEALTRVTGVSNVEDTLSGNPVLEWILKPETRPELEEVGPVLEPDAHKRSELPNLVTGKGGVVESMKKRFSERLREKILGSVHELP